MRRVASLLILVGAVVLSGCASPVFQSRMDRVTVVDAARFGPVFPVIAPGAQLSAGARVVVHRGLSDAVVAKRYPNPSAEGAAQYGVSSQEALKAVERALSGPLTEPQRSSLSALRDELALFEYRRRKSISTQNGMGSFQYRRLQRMIHQ